MTIWGITGTNGKTTSTWILTEFLRAAGRKCGYITTVEVDTLARHFSTGYTTPPLNVLKDIFAELATQGASDCVMEVSSHAIYQRRTGDTIFAGGIFTNLTLDHLDYHKTMENYYAAKKLFFTRLAAENPNAPAAICIDGEYGRRLAQELKPLALNVITFGFAQDADVRPAQFDFSRLPLVGDYNIQNVLGAATLAKAAGVAESIIAKTIPTLTPRWGRLECVPCAAAAKVYVDFAHTDDALANVLRTLRAITAKDVWVVFGAGGDRDATKRPLMGKAAARFANHLIITSDNPRSEDPETIIAQIVAGIPKNVDFITHVDRAQAIAYALSNAQEGDAVIICGKGAENTQTIGMRVIPFDDRLVAAAFDPVRKVCATL